MVTANPTIAACEAREIKYCFIYSSSVNQIGLRARNRAILGPSPSRAAASK